MFNTITIIVLTAAAAVFAALYFSNRKDVLKYESKSEGLTSELTGVKEELAKVQASSGSRMLTLKPELILDYLKNTEGLESEFLDGNEMISYKVGDERYHIDTRRLPLQVILRKGYSLDGVEIDWDIMRKAALNVADELIMVKMNVNQEHNTYDYYIVSPDRTLDNFSKNFEFYMSLFRDAESRFSERYHEYEEMAKAAGKGNFIPAEYIKHQCESQKMKS